jgi:hypothetical protein
MKLEDTKRHIVEVVVNCPLITDFSEYNGDKYSDCESLIKDIMSNFDTVDTGHLQGEDRDITYTVEAVNVEFTRGIENVRGHYLIDIWKEAYKKFKAHEIKSLGRVIEKTITKLNDKKVLTVMADTMKSMHGRKKEHTEEKERYVHFMGTEHLTQPSYGFESKVGRLSQEVFYINQLVHSVRLPSTDIVKTKALIKAIIHRSPEQRELINSTIQAPASFFESIDAVDARKRGMMIDEALDEMLGTDPAEINLNELASSHNVSEAEQQPTHVDPEMKELLVEILATLKQLQPKDNVVETKVQLSGGESLNLRTPTEDNIRAFIKTFGAKSKSEEPNQETRPVLKYELPEGARKELVISGDPEDPLIKDIIKLFQDSALDVKVNKKESPKLEDSEFSAENIIRGYGLYSPYAGKSGQECKDTTCPVHGENILPQRQPHPFDYIIGIDPGNKKGDVHHVHILKGRGEDGENPIYKLKGQEIDFSGHRGFARPPRSTLEQIFGSEFARVSNVSDEPQPTATEIETTTHVVINQSFIIYDVKGEFFCEYKMNWNSEMTNFRFTHDKPDSPKGRRFYPIRDLSKKMTEDEALKQFQSLRRAVLVNGPHKPRPSSLTPNW